MEALASLESKHNPQTAPTGATSTPPAWLQSAVIVETAAANSATHDAQLSEAIEGSGIETVETAAANSGGTHDAQLSEAMAGTETAKVAVQEMAAMELYHQRGQQGLMQCCGSNCCGGFPLNFQLGCHRSRCQHQVEQCAVERTFAANDAPRRHAQGQPSARSRKKHLANENEHSCREALEFWRA